MKFKVLDAMGDTGFEAFGKTKKELFENSAMALFDVLADTKKIKCRQKKEVSAIGENLDLLLYNFLSELVFLKDQSHMVFCRCKVKLSKTKKELKAMAVVCGEPVEKLDFQTIRSDVKAVTLHKFEIYKTKKGNTATVILDL